MSRKHRACRRGVFVWSNYIMTTIMRTTSALIRIDDLNCDALNFSVRKATKLVRSLSELVQAVRKLWQK